jgi:hypothetical protein
MRRVTREYIFHATLAAGVVHAFFRPEPPPPFKGSLAIPVKGSLAIPVRNSLDLLKEEIKEEIKENMHPFSSINPPMNF